MPNPVYRSEAIDLIVESLRQKGSVRFVASGSSMRPLISPGQLLEVRAINQVELGDIALVHQEDSLRAHRVIAIDGNNIVTRGDAHAVADLPTRINDVVGIVSAMYFGTRRVSLERRLPRVLGCLLASEFARVTLPPIMEAGRRLKQMLLRG